MSIKQLTGLRTSYAYCPLYLMLLAAFSVPSHLVCLYMTSIRRRRPIESGVLLSNFPVSLTMDHMRIVSPRYITAWRWTSRLILYCEGWEMLCMYYLRPDVLWMNSRATKDQTTVNKCYFCWCLYCNIELASDVLVVSERERARAHTLCHVCIHG